MNQRHWLLASAVLLGMGLSQPVGSAEAQTRGVTEITIGQTMPYSGPASIYGTIGKAEAAYFRMINDRGGINGRKVRLISLDDGYTPPKTMEQTRKLVESEEVLLLFSIFGTATNVAVQRYLNQHGVPQLFPISGATRWGDPGHFPWTMGFQPTLQLEGRIIARYVLEHRPGAKIGVLYQNDDFGRDYLKGLKDGLGQNAATTIVSEVTYEGTEPMVDSQIIALKASGAEVFVDISTAKFTAQAIRKTYDIAWNPLHVVFSGATGRSEVLRPAGLDKAAGLISAAWAKDPTDPQWKDDAATKDWLAWMSQYYPEGDPASSFNVAGYNWAMLMVEVLRRCGDDLTRANVMRQATNLDTSLPMLLPGIRVSTGPKQFFPVREMQLKRFTGQFWEKFSEVISSTE
jgi:ABC-type branched-subunit amino acid transport system substrate-binding protein